MGEQFSVGNDGNVCYKKSLFLMNMEYNINDRLEFGKYSGLSVKEIYQGTLNIDRGLLQRYLKKILNEGDAHKRRIDFRLIDKFDVSLTEIKVVGEIHDHEKSVSVNNRVIRGNMQQEISTFINYHFADNFLGILENLESFNKLQDKPTVLGGDPEYLSWCEREVDDFKLSLECKKNLEKLSVARLVGVQVLYNGDESYNYTPSFEVQSFKF